MARSYSATVPANYAERRIIALETFMLTTHLRGKAALAAFNARQEEMAKKPPPPFVDVAQQKIRLRNFFANIDREITVMRGYPDYWKHHDVRRG